MSGREYRPRLADGLLAELMAAFPAVMITGARATGKTSTALEHTAEVARLDQPGVASGYRSDPDAALRRAGRPLLLDEWQAVPEVLAAVKRAVDTDPAPGQFVLTGSVRADLALETWAGTGRTVRMSMFPLTERELTGRPVADRPSFLERLASSGIRDLSLPHDVPDINGYIELALRGGFPEIAYRDRTARQRGIWLTSYLDDLVTRDARLAGAVKDPAKLRRYLNVLALHNAGMPALLTLNRCADLDARTAAGYDQLLRDLYVLDVVPAWAVNRISRLVKAGRRYLIDSGLAAVAAGLTADLLLEDPDLVGRYFDAFALAQLRPEVALMHPRPTLHHLRAESGRHEVDLVVELGAGRVLAIEVKAGAAPGDRDARHLRWLRDRLGAAFVRGAVIHSGPAMYEMGDRVVAVPLCAMWG